MLISSIRRGLAAGLLAGVLAGLFAFVIGEIPIREAIELEEAREAAPADDPTVREPDEHDEAAFVVSRTTQQALLPVATAIISAAFGGLFGVVFAFARRFIRDPTHWRAAVKLGAVAWTVMALVPALAAPATPPGVGDPGAINTRSAWYLGVIGLAIVLAVAIRVLAHQLRARGLGEAPRHAVLAVITVTGFGGLMLLAPTSTDADGSGFPGELLWQFRMASLATQTLLWAGIAVVFGLLWDRDSRRDGVVQELSS